MTEPEPTCAGSVGCQRRPHVGLLCRDHADRLGTLLRDVEEEAIYLDSRKSLAITHDQAGGGLASHQAPAVVDVVTLIDRRHSTGRIWLPEDDADPYGWDDTPSVLETLHAWARVVREDRDLATPERITVTGERDLLTRQLPWIAEQPWVDELMAELTALVKALRRVNGTWDEAVGKCDTLQPDGNLCDGDVWHVIIHPDGTLARGTHTKPGPDDEPGFRCGRCRRVWTGTEAVRKRDDLWRDEQARKAEKVQA